MIELYVMLEYMKYAPLIFNVTSEKCTTLNSYWNVHHHYMICKSEVEKKFSAEEIEEKINTYFNNKFKAIIN